jgi:peroxiredoxin Q/BCP
MARLRNCHYVSAFVELQKEGDLAMRMLASVWKMVVLGAVCSVGVEPVRGGELKPGDPAPDFSLHGSDGKTYQLSDFHGRKAVVLAWFPKAFTPGCTAECKSFHTRGADLKAFDVAYFTISCDDPETNQKFAQSLDLDYPILSDLGCKVAKEYGVLIEGRKMAQRWTFYIDRGGKIVKIDKSVKTKTHGEDVAAALRQLGVAKK